VSRLSRHIRTVGGKISHVRFGLQCENCYRQQRVRGVVVQLLFLQNAAFVESNHTGLRDKMQV